FVVDTAAFRLCSKGKPVRVEPKALQILILLIERRDRLVTKQELLSEVWPGVAVTENALTRAIAQLRKTLGDSADAPKYIETIPTRGYRFIAPLLTGQPLALPARRARSRVFAVAAMAAVVAVAALAILTFVRSVIRRIEIQLPNGIYAEAPPP